MRLGRHVTRFGPALALALVALVSWQAALEGDTDEVSTTPVRYDQSLTTPMLSARRIPQTLQAPVVDAAIRPSIGELAAQSPPTSCLTVLDGDRLVAPPSNPAVALVPASNQKLLTTFVALELLGSDFRFATTVMAPSAPVGGTVGDLYLVGSGDPFLTTDSWWGQYDDLDGRDHTRLEDLADAVAAAGITTVSGTLFGDESLFDTERTGPWADRLISGNYSGPLSALTVNEGFVDWPDTSGQSGRSRVESDDPAADAVAAFADLLTERGVTVAATATGQAPAGALEVARVDSPPLLDLATHINSHSSNIGAELVLKRIGADHGAGGTTAAGAVVVTDTLATLGIPTEGLEVYDGSGLAETNAVTCATLSGLLAHTGPDSDLAQTLAIGADRGTLDERFVDTAAAERILAKTGTLNGAIALSGYVLSTNEAGSALTFAYVANEELIIFDDELEAEIDEFVVDLTAYPGRPSVDELSPRAPIER